MIIHQRYPGFAARVQPWVKRIAIVFLVILVVGLVVKEHALLASRFIAVAPVAITLCLLSMSTGYLLCSSLKLPEPQRTAIIIDSMMQSGGIAMVIAISLTGMTTAAIPAAMYSLFMYLSAAGFVLYRNFSDPDSVG